MHRKIDDVYDPTRLCKTTCSHGWRRTPVLIKKYFVKPSIERYNHTRRTLALPQREGHLFCAFRIRLGERLHQGSYRERQNGEGNQ